MPFQQAIVGFLIIGCFPLGAALLCGGFWIFRNAVKDANIHAAVFSLVVMAFGLLYFWIGMYNLGLARMPLTF